MGYREDFQQNVKNRFLNDITEHVIEKKSSPSDYAQVWMCSRPNSGIFRFYVCSLPGFLFVYGDLGEFVWRRCEDMLYWAESAIGSLDYFSEKVPDTIVIREEKPELIEEWFKEFPEEWSEYNELTWGETQQEKLDDIRNTWENYGIAEDFKAALYESDFCRDHEGIPETEWYTYHYLWIIEGLKWFLPRVGSNDGLKFFEKCFSAARKHYPKLSKEDHWNLLFGATCYPFGSPEQVEEQLIELRKNTNGTLGHALAYANSQMEAQMAKREGDDES